MSCLGDTIKKSLTYRIPQQANYGDWRIQERVSEVQLIVKTSAMNLYEDFLPNIYIKRKKMQTSFNLNLA